MIFARCVECLSEIVSLYMVSALIDDQSLLTLSCAL